MPIAFAVLRIDFAAEVFRGSASYTVVAETVMEMMSSHALLNVRYSLVAHATYIFLEHAHKALGFSLELH